MTVYRLHNGTVDTDADDCGPALARAQASHERPQCLCRTPHPLMYIARAGQTYIVKRMPNTGAHHAPTCTSYEPPAELSGLGEVVGSAIKEDADTGITTLKLDFALLRTGARKAPVQGNGEADTVRTDGKKLTLRGLLHLLWSDAGFNRWSPAMEGKRQWPTIRRYLLEALAGKEAKGEALAGAVFVPEPFKLDDKDAIAARRSAKLAQLTASAGRGKRLMVLVGEVKDIELSRYGHKVVVKHLADYPFMLNDDIHKRLATRFGGELGTWRADNENHLMMIATFGVGPTGYASIEEASLMLTSPQWLPIEDAWDGLLVRALVEHRRHFVKGLRFNLASAKPLASAVTADTRPDPVAMYVLPAVEKPGYRESMRELLKGSSLPAWFWKPGDDAPMPPLPAALDYQPMTLPDGEDA